MSGAWAPPASSVSLLNYPATPACPVAAGASASTALAYTVGTCITMGSSASIKATCSGTSYTVTQYGVADCSGSGTPTTGSLGCGANPASGQPGVTGVSVSQCTSGASSASIAFASIALMLVAAASASAL